VSDWSKFLPAACPREASERSLKQWNELQRALLRGIAGRGGPGSREEWSGGDGMGIVNLPVTKTQLCPLAV